MRTITEDRLRRAVSAAGLPDDAFERIQAALASEPEDAPGFEMAHIAYYLGALLIIGAMGWFITSAWDSLPGSTLSLIALAYGAVFGGAGARLYQRPGTRVPGGVLIAVAVCMTPMAVYGIERQIGWWPADDPGGYARFHPYIHASWVWMEAATVVVAGLALRFARFPFITAPAAYALWYLSMDATALLFGKNWTFHQECWISVGFGLVMMVVAYVLEGEREMDLSFWLYLFGLLTFTGGLTVMGNSHQLGKAVYCAIHLALIVLSVILRRRVFLVFGAVGVFAYLVSEAEGYFRNSFGFTIALTVLGVLFIAAGLACKRHEDELTSQLDPWIPDRIRHRHA